MSRRNTDGSSHGQGCGARRRRVIDSLHAAGPGRAHSWTHTDYDEPPASTAAGMPAASHRTDPAISCTERDCSLYAAPPCSPAVRQSIRSHTIIYLNEHIHIIARPLEADRISFSFSFSAPKNAFFLFFGRKRCTYFRCILFFGTNMAVKITENSERFNSADARRAS